MSSDTDVYRSDWADLARRKWADYQRLVQRFEAGDTSVSTAIDLRETALAKLVPHLAEEIQQLRDADGLARDALRRSGYHFSADSDKPLAELIEKLNADARAAVQACGEESARLRGIAERRDVADTRRAAAIGAVRRLCRRSADPFAVEVLKAIETALDGGDRS